MFCLPILRFLHYLYKPSIFKCFHPPTPWKFNSSPLKISHPKRKVIFKPSFFRGELLNFGGVNPPKKSVHCLRPTMGYPNFGTSSRPQPRICRQERNRGYNSVAGENLAGELSPEEYEVGTTVFFFGGQKL